MISIQDVVIDPQKAKNIISCNMLCRKGYLIVVNFYPPLADIIFLFRSKKNRDKAFNDAQQENDNV